MAPAANNELIYSSLVEYCCCGAVTVAADVTINHVEADDLGHTMMLNDLKYNSNPAVFSASSSSVNTFWSSLLLSLSLEYVFAPAWNGLILRFAHHGILGCRRVVFVRAQGKRNRSALDHRQYELAGNDATVQFGMVTVHRQQ